MNGEEIKILIVDDDDDVAGGTAHLLKRAGYVTATAANGVEALRALSAFGPHLILSDRNMPEMDGVELCRRIKADPALAGVFVILISGAYTQSEEQAEGLESGADGYITRPIANRELLARVESYVRIVRLQIHLTQARKMETVGLLAGGVAHTFNNRLTGILNYVELCRDKLPPEHPVRPFLDEITLDAERSAELTRLLLAFSSKQTIVPKVLDLNDTVVGILILLRPLIGENIDVDWVPGKELWPVKLDPSQVNRILASLCTNSRDASAGEVIVATANVTVEHRHHTSHMDAIPGDYVLLAVEDNGCGMDRYVLDRLFEPFFTTKGLSSGAGLGLSSVYGIVRQNNGFIDIESEAGKGTIFRVYFPRSASAAVVSSQPDVPTSPPGGQETILVVDDEKSIRTTTGMFLEHLGFAVLVAEGPETALRLAAEHSGTIDLLLTDVIMPSMNGWQLSERLRIGRPDLKRLFMSGYPADELVSQGVFDENMPLLVKPFCRDALARKVREVLEKA